jgi:formylglycine-generating enzyme required for sulfatase activity
MIGRTFGQYRILEMLGQGGMGEVYLAEDTTLDRKVALKFLPPELRGDEIARRRFLREAKSAAGLDHPFICHIHETGESEDISFIVMERVAGQTLRDKLAAGQLSLSEALRIAEEMAEALIAAHEAGIVHRDLKPANVMLTGDGHVKVMDFGLAKPVSTGEESQEVTLSELTREGTTVGTVPYMSPEQLQGKPVDVRSDLFSFGVMLYEMLTGKHPFMRATTFETAGAILSEKPPPLSEHLDTAPKHLQTLLDLLLTVDRAARVQSAAEVRTSLREFSESARAAADGRVFRYLKRPAVMAALALALVVIGAMFWLPFRARQKVERARALMPELERLTTDGRYTDAYELATRIEESLPGDPTLQRVMPDLSDVLTINTEPDGANVYLQRFTGGTEEPHPRILVGTSPVVDLRIARVGHRLWLEKDGFVTLERTISSELNRAEGRLGVEPEIVLAEALPVVGTVPDDMVQVPGGTYRLRGYGFGGMDVVTLDDFFIDRFEVSNEDYQAFIRAGGYSNPSYWMHPFVRDGVEMTYDDAMALFRDRSGLSGPRGWSNQEFPEDKASHPVTGISWYEAAAYAEYAGKALPTIYQWEKAARAGRYTHFEGYVMPWGLMSAAAPSGGRANYHGRDTTPVDSHPFGMSPYGVYNMAGNVEEWCLNERGPGRATAGGSWADEPYQFPSGGVLPELDASDTVGLRCVSKSAGDAADQGSGRIKPKQSIVELTPVDDATYRGFLSHYRYDRTPPVAEVLETIDGPDWVREKLTFAGLGDGRIIAYLYLPKRARAPYQCINYVVSATVFMGRTAAEEVEAILAPQIKAGRAVMAVVPKGAIEREWPPDHQNSPWNSVERRNLIIFRVTEFRMGLDYLETREEIDMGRIAHIGFSWGSCLRALILTAIEDRIQSSIFVGGGLEPIDLLPEVDPVNFLPRISGPVLVLTGRYDEETPYEPQARSLFEAVRAPKRLELVESGHLPPVEVRNPIISEFLDETLGPVERSIGNPDTPR